MYGAFDGDGAALVFCNAYVQPKQYFVFGNIAISVRNILCGVQQIGGGAGRKKARKELDARCGPGQLG
ncbi:hypothetical protein [Janthinobacterium sp. HH01]|uniref:hypothetical protein n=1 Tax=Janthinobacterium sp. HH01 TaxID=1198452 RepID=UPI0012687CD2|nr:hypothetical protein [Janthinobacterium sp. HH01]